MKTIAYYKKEYVIPVFSMAASLMLAFGCSNKDTTETADASKDAVTDSKPDQSASETSTTDEHRKITLVFAIPDLKKQYACLAAFTEDPEAEGTNIVPLSVVGPVGKFGVGIPQPVDGGPPPSTTNEGFEYGSVLPIAVDPATDDGKQAIFAFDKLKAVPFLVDAVDGSGTTLPANKTLCQLDWTKNATKPKYRKVLQPGTIKAQSSWIAAFTGCVDTAKNPEPTGTCGTGKKSVSVLLQELSTQKLTVGFEGDTTGNEVGIQLFHFSQFVSFQNTDIYIQGQGPSVSNDAGVDSGPREIYTPVKLASGLSYMDGNMGPFTVPNKAVRIKGKAEDALMLIVPAGTMLHPSCYVGVPTPPCNGFVVPLSAFITPGQGYTLVGGGLKDNQIVSIMGSLISPPPVDGQRLRIAFAPVNL